MPRYLKITDGTTTINLDGTSAADYFNVRWGQWAPSVSRLDTNMLSGDKYVNVVEDIPLKVKSTTDIATLLSNIEELNTLIMQAQRWYLGENVDPVIIRMSPNSDSVYQEAAIIGPPPGQSAIELPDTFEGLLQNVSVNGLRLRFVRRGQWLGSEDTASGSTVAQGVKGSVTFSAAPDIASPVRVAMSGTHAFPSDDTIIFAQNTDDIEIIDRGTSVAGTWALGTYITNDVIPASVGTITSSSISASGNMPSNHVTIYASVRTTVEVSFRIALTCQGIEKYTSWKTVNSSIPISVNLGNVAFKSGVISSLEYQIKHYGTSGNFYIDYFCLFNTNNLLNSAIQCSPPASAFLNIDHALLTSPTSNVYGIANQHTSFIGSADIYCEGATLYYAHIGTGATGTDWRHPNSPVTDVETFGHSFAMRHGNLIPQ